MEEQYMVSDGQFVSPAQRLERFGLSDRAGALESAEVAPGAEVRITPDDDRFADRMVVLQAGSVNDLKRWLGVPPGAVAQSEPAPAQQAGFVSTDRFLPHPPLELEPEFQEDLLSYVLRNPILENPTPAEKRMLDNLNRAIQDFNMAAKLILNLDIHIGKGATLVVTKKMNSLFAANITMEDDAKIVMESPFSQIDCASLRHVLSRPPYFKETPLWQLWS